MAEAARLVLGILTRMGEGRLDVIDTVAALRDYITPEWSDEVSVWVPSMSVDRLALVPDSRDEMFASLPEDVHDAVKGLIERDRQGLLEPHEVSALAGRFSHNHSLNQAMASAVIAPLTMPGQAAGACIYLRSARRSPFTAHEADVLLTATARCTPLILAAALSDHQVFERDLIRSLPEAVIAVDQEFRVLRWNPAAEHLYDVFAEDAIGESLATLYFTHYDDPEMNGDRAWEELLANDHWEGFVTQRSKSGKTVSVFASVTTVRDGTGRLIGAVAVNRDTSEIAAARSQVNLAEQMLTEILNAAGAMAVVLDPDGLIVAANREWLDVALATDAPMQLVSVGADYLRPVRTSVAAGDITAKPALQLLESVLTGSQTAGSTEYRCDRPDGPHWYRMDVRQISEDRAAIVSHREVTEQHLLEVELAHTKTHDTLTDLGNRQWLEQRVAQCLAGRAQDAGEIGMIVCDVDGFAAVNETLGYTLGDDVLRTLAGRLRDVSPPRLSVVRLGGDQFGVFAGNMWGSVPLVDVAERLRTAVAKPIEIDGRQLALSLSVGIASILPHTDQSAVEITSELVARADTARLDSKTHGRNRVRYYRPDLRDRATSLLLMRHDFAEALRNDSLELYYQQIRRLTDEAVVGFEALLRWPRVGGPLLTPATFGPLLDEPTIAGPVAAWTIGMAAEAAHILRGDPTNARIRIGVNISARQFLDLDVATYLEAAMSVAGIPPAALVVEVTETATFDDDDRVLTQLTRISGSGVRVALDDFGTGYSSLTHLKSLPVNEVKVDKTFTAGVGTDPTSNALVRSLIALAHDLGLEVIAEGVETRTQRGWLADAGCDSYQGFLAHRPARLADILASDGH